MSLIQRVFYYQGYIYFKTNVVDEIVRAGLLRGLLLFPARQSVCLL